MVGKEYVSADYLAGDVRTVAASYPNDVPTVPNDGHGGTGETEVGDHISLADSNGVIGFRSRDEAHATTGTVTA